MRDEYKFDYGKAKPNRFAVRADQKHTPILLDPDIAAVPTTPQRFTLVDILESEHSNIKERLESLAQVGVVDLFDRMLGIMINLFKEVSLYSNSAEYIPAKGHKATKTVRGSHIPNWNIRLFVQMLGSSLSQFVFAASHVFRGHAPEAYGHVRRAIEGAGITYLSLSEPDIGELYGSADEDRWRNRIYTNKILPKYDELTRDLNSMIRKASKQVHNNVNSISKNIVEEVFIKKDKQVVYKYGFSITDDMRVEHVWDASYYILTAAYYVSRLYAKSFNLSEGEWQKQLEDYRSDVERINLSLRNHFEQHPPS